MADPDIPNLPGRIGRYQVLRLLGSGAMGSVVLAEDPLIKRKVAIKLLKGDSGRTEADRLEFLARFQREAEVSGLLNHPGIVAIYDVGEEPGQGPFLAMEFVQGRPLDGIMKGGTPLNMKEKLRIAVGLAEALDHAHAKGITHRDVKPGNVMVGDDGRPKLMDFGIAKREDASLTQTGTFLGTPSYASPEQIKDGTVDSRSDLFSFAVVVFELLSGQSPFPGTSINTILYRIVNEPPAEVQPPVVGLLPEGWQRVFLKALAKEPQARYPSCAVFMRDLLDAVTELGKDERREVLSLLGMGGDGSLPAILSTSFDETMVVPRPQGKRSGWVWGGLLGLACAGLVGWFLWQRPRGIRTQIETRPPGAKVFVNDLAVGTTPTNQPLAPGDRVRFEQTGFRPATVEVKPGQPLGAVELEPILSEERIDSHPPGATVVFDEHALEGTTPMTLPWNQGQAHRLTLTKGNLAFALNLAPGEVPGGRTFVLAEARPATPVEPALDPAEPGRLRNAGAYGTRVKADGKDLGEVPPGGEITLAPGSHRLELSSPGHYFREARNVQVLPGKTASLALPRLVSLTVETFPGTGKVFLDGQDTGSESDGSTSLKVAAGAHTVTVRGAKAIKEVPIDLTGDRALKIPL